MADGNLYPVAQNYNPPNKGVHWAYSSGNAHTAPQNSNAWVWPNTLYTSTSASGATTTDNTVIYTSPDVSAYNYHLIENTSSTDPVDVYISVDGTNFLSSASAVKLHDATASATHVVTIPIGDVGILEGSFAKIRVLKDGVTAETPSIRVAHGVK